MKNTNITICNETVHPGEILTLALPLPELFSCAPMYMPIKVVHGKQQGPCLLVIAAMHGNELNGTEIINRLLSSPAIKKLKGSLITVPIMNVYGFINKSRLLPGDVSLSQTFPGSESGSHAARMAHLFTKEIFSLADYCIDLQTGWLNHSNLPQVYIDQSNSDEKQLASVFSAPVISHADAKQGSLRNTAKKNKTPYLVYEAGEAMRFDEHAIRVGLKGITNIMKTIGMLTSKVNNKQAQSFMVEDSCWLRSPTSGICHPYVKLGQEVAQGQKIGVIKDPFGAGEDVIVYSPVSGVVVSANNLPLVHEGIALLQIATFTKQEKAASHFEDWSSTDHLAQQEG